MKLSKLIYAGVPVSDQDAAIDFYANVLGLEQRADVPTRDGPRFVMMGVPGQDFDLILWPGKPSEIAAGSGAFTLEVEDIGAAFETLTDRGVTFDPPEIIDYPWGQVARFRDPDGNLWQIREGR